MSIKTKYRKIKINLKKVVIFRNEKPVINYKNVKIPAQHIEVYIDFLSP